MATILASGSIEHTGLHPADPPSCAGWGWHRNCSRMNDWAMGVGAGMAEEPPTILLVDDDEAYCTIIRELLVRHNFQVRVAGTAEEALRLMRRGRPEIILTDILNPDLDAL